MNILKLNIDQIEQITQSVCWYTAYFECYV